MFFKIGVLKSFSHFTGKHLCRSLLLITLQAFRLATLIKRDSILSYPVKLAKFSRRTPVAASEFCSGGCVTIVSVSSIRCISKYSMYKGQCMINSMMLHSLQDNAGIRHCTFTFVVPCFQTWFHLDTFWYFWIVLLLL